MSKLMTDSAFLCLGMVRDAFGNGFMGDAERSLRYLVLAARGLELHVELLQNRNDPRVESKVRAFHRELNAELDAFPPLDTSRADESMERFSEAGIEDILPKVDIEGIPGLQPVPGQQMHVAQLKGDDVRKFFAAMAGRPAH